MLTVTLQPTT